MGTVWAVMCMDLYDQRDSVCARAVPISVTWPSISTGIRPNTVIVWTSPGDGPDHDQLYNLYSVAGVRSAQRLTDRRKTKYFHIYTIA